MTPADIETLQRALSILRGLNLLPEEVEGLARVRIYGPTTDPSDERARLTELGLVVGHDPTDAGVIICDMVDLFGRR